MQFLSELLVTNGSLKLCNGKLADVASESETGQRQLNVCVSDGVDGVYGLLIVTQTRQKHALYALKIGGQTVYFDPT